MDKSAGKLLGETILTGLTVSSRGEAAKMIKRSGGGVVGSAVARAMDGKQTIISTPANHSGTMYIALGETHIAFFSVKQGFFKNSLGDLLIKHPRSEIQSIDIQKSAIPKIDFVFEGGTHYGFECGRVFLKQVKKMKKILGK